MGVCKEAAIVVAEHWGQQRIGDEDVLVDDLDEFVVDRHVGGVDYGMWNGGHELKIAGDGIEPCFSAIWNVTIGFNQFFNGRFAECG